MGVKKIFQTLEDRNNPDEVESQGPFICTNKQTDILKMKIKSK